MPISKVHQNASFLHKKVKIFLMTEFIDSVVLQSRVSTWCRQNRVIADRRKVGCFCDTLSWYYYLLLL